MYVLALSDYKQLAAAAGYKPAPPIKANKTSGTEQKPNFKKKK